MVAVEAVVVEVVMKEAVMWSTLRRRRHLHREAQRAERTLQRLVRRPLELLGRARLRDALALALVVVVVVVVVILVVLLSIVVLGLVGARR